MTPYCADHDPLLVAGFTQCRACGAMGCPLDAEWISPTLVLATYEAPCRHQRPYTVILDPDSVLETAGIDPANYLKGRRCTGRNKRGRPCRANALPGSHYCWAHRARDDLLKALREVHASAYNAWTGGGPGSAHGRLAAYIAWATDAVYLLENRISAADLDCLVLTRGYERLLDGLGTLTGTDIGTERAVNGLVSLELRQRMDAFDRAVKDLDAQIARWAGHCEFVVADTSIYIEHEDKLQDLDFAPLVQAWADKPIRVLVPIVVVDELDRLKRSGDPRTRWRAGYTLAVFDKLFARPGEVARLRAADAAGDRGEVAIELLFDPPGHVRLPINDDEIIDRALAAQALAGQNITLLTFDTGQASRARYAGLRIKKLATAIEAEPSAARVRKKPEVPGT